MKYTIGHMEPCGYVGFWQHHIVPYLVLKFSYFVFFPCSDPIFMLLFGGLSEPQFLQNRYPQKALDVQFHWLWPCSIWSYGRQDIAFGREVMQFKKFCNTFLEKFIYLNPQQISSSSFCGRQSRRYTSILCRRITPIVAQLVQFFA